MFIAEVKQVTSLETEAAPQRSTIPGPPTRDPQKPVTLLSITENYTCCSPDRRATASLLLKGGGGLRCKLWTAAVSRIWRAEDGQHPGEKLQRWWYSEETRTKEEVRIFWRGGTRA